MPLAGHGMVQGMAISPREFMQRIHDDHLAEIESSLTQASDGAYSVHEQSMESQPGKFLADGDGDTAATTSSYLSQISVWEFEDGEGSQEPFGTEIPYKEQDDPPDAEAWAASLDDERSSKL
mmetsp:Transcript_11263/g.16202  ORF Transcript_11263/g.16202 Transcript_11263/m.16202 type:complete len:122 (-) Transcript_11263:37-402(-)